MKAISIRQPWAWLIANGYKDIENRTWRTLWRGTILIHASATMTRADYEACEIFVAGILDVLPPARCALESEHPLRLKFPHFHALRTQLGGIVGFTTITDCVTKSASPWFTGDFGFVCKDSKTVPFHPCKGRQGLFTIPDDLLRPTD